MIPQPNKSYYLYIHRMTHFPCLFRVCLCLPILLAMLGTSAWAARKQSSPATFAHWLKQYQAWDVYEKELSGQANSPDNLLARGETLLRLRKPQEAMTLLAGSFSDPAQESRRLLLLARATRLMGDYPACILHWLNFAGAHPQDSTYLTMRKEPGLDLLFEDVWQQLFWASYFTQHTDLFATRHPMMSRMLELGSLVWPNHPFWEQARPVFSRITTLFGTASSSSVSKTLEGDQKPVMNPDREYIGKALAAWSLGFWDQGDTWLHQVNDPRLVQFWQQCAVLAGHPVNDHQDMLKQSIRPDFFTLFAPQIRSITHWVLTPPDSPSWPSFADTLQSLGHAEALARVLAEQASLFLPESVGATLDVCAFALKLQHQGAASLQKDWNTFLSKEHPPPLLLQLAYMILGGHAVMPEKVSEARLLRYLLAAALVPSDGGVMEDFWQQSQDVAASSAAFPLDYLLEYNNLAATSGHRYATQLAFLYPNSPAAQKGLLLLARRANQDGHHQLAWSYLQKIQTKDLDPSDRIEFLLARAGMEMELGHEDAALKDYALLMKEQPERIPLEKQLKLALLAQQKRQWAWAQDILESLWQRRATLTEPLRAEILFWLGEGAQSQGRMQEALTFYLRLAWSYPQQHIWAVTAMYRAGLIYEKRREFETAKRLYTTVLKQSDRKSQKEAAKTRIASVNAEIQRSQHNQPMPLF